MKTCGTTTLLLPSSSASRRRWARRSSTCTTATTASSSPSSKRTRTRPSTRSTSTSSSSAASSPPTSSALGRPVLYVLSAGRVAPPPAPPPADGPVDTDDIFEIAMEGMAHHVCARYLQASHPGLAGAALASRMTAVSGVGALLPGVTIDDWAFEPCGYSMNGLQGEYYYTVHVTPEDGFSCAAPLAARARSHVPPPSFCSGAHLPCSPPQLRVVRDQRPVVPPGAPRPAGGRRLPALGAHAHADDAPREARVRRAAPPRVRAQHDRGRRGAAGREGLRDQLREAPAQPAVARQRHVGRRRRRRRRRRRVRRAAGAPPPNRRLSRRRAGTRWRRRRWGRWRSLRRTRARHGERTAGGRGAGRRAAGGKGEEGASGRVHFEEGRRALPNAIRDSY